MSDSNNVEKGTAHECAVCFHQAISHADLKNHWLKHLRSDREDEESGSDTVVKHSKLDHSAYQLCEVSVTLKRIIKKNCPDCSYSTYQKDNLEEHVENAHA
jgi:hypothetical protein